MTFPKGKYQVVYADPPWPYYGDPNKMAAAGKHYSLMSLDEIGDLPIKGLMEDKAALFLWATCPRLPDAIEVIKRWGLHYRGVAWIWVKTRKNGGIINGQGVPPTFVKPTAELLLAATTNRTGRPFPIQDYSMGQVVLAPREAHSTKPSTFRKNIEYLCGDVTKIELFARATGEGWDAWGDELAVGN